MQRIMRTAETWRYVLVDDRPLPDNEQAVFVLSPMTVTERAIMRDNLTLSRVNPDGTTTIVGRRRETALALFLEHVEAIENFPADKPQPWPAAREARLQYLEMVADADIEEVADDIYRRAYLGVPEKNFSAPEHTSSSRDGSQAKTSSTTATRARKTRT